MGCYLGSHSDPGLNPWALIEQLPAFAGIGKSAIFAREGGGLHF